MNPLCFIHSLCIPAALLAALLLLTGPPASAGDAVFDAIHLSQPGRVLLPSLPRGEGADGKLEYTPEGIRIQGQGKFDAVAENQHDSRLLILDDSAWSAEILVKSFSAATPGDRVGITLSTRLRGGGNAGNVSAALAAANDSASPFLAGAFAGEATNPVAPGTSLTRTALPLTLKISKPGTSDTVRISGSAIPDINATP